MASPMSAALAKYALEAARFERERVSQPFTSIEGLRKVHEEWGRAILGIPRGGPLVSQVRAAVERGLGAAVAEDAMSHLEEAERWQWTIGTWATGSGEGLASMSEVRTLQLARAWLLCARSSADPTSAGSARALVAEVVSDPNQVAARHAGEISRLQRALDAR